MAEEAPYWRRHHGVAGQWTPTRAGRTGCLWMLGLTFAVLVLGLIMAAV